MLCAEASPMEKPLSKRVGERPAGTVRSGPLQEASLQSRASSQCSLEDPQCHCEKTRTTALDWKKDSSLDM
ncbi:hypothetical protein OH76DRAFT_974137 [Lentinus brumalis]|uniref:Uncharacterized protein n=1 Tax=Lentinus brumalis TaxID=2498619 RepID=A0A371DPR2_9APHY|nr:hypothetical protein OH76DRAFT_974137 [Polyporus brumalis]